MNDFGFLNSSGAYILLVLVPLLFILFRLEGRLEMALSAFRLRNSSKRMRLILYLLILTLLGIALLRPYFGKKEISVSEYGRDYILAVDISYSMLASDTPPSRLELAKRKIYDLVELLSKRSRGDRIGIVLFAGAAYLYCPLTSDYSILHVFTNAISPELITEPGSALSSAIIEAVKSLKEVNSKNATIIVLSDGEEPQSSLQESMAEAKELGATISSIGFGTVEGRPIEIAPSVFVKDRFGNIVISKLKEDILQEIATAGTGIYTRATLGDQDLLALLADEGDLSNALLDTVSGRAEKKYQVFNEYGSYLVLIALITIVVAVVFKVPGIIFSAVLFSCATQLQAEEVPNLYQASKAYNAGDFETAYKGFEAGEKRSQDPKINQALGSSAYKLNRYEDASKQYTTALKSPLTYEERFNTLYNLGNSQFKMDKFDSAITNYEEALRLFPQDERAKHNLELARKKLQEQQEKKEQQEQQQKQNQNQSQDQQSQSDKEQNKESSNSDDSESSEDESSDQESNSEENSSKQPNQESDQEVEKKSGAGEASDAEPLSQNQAKAWIDSLSDAPVLLYKKRRTQNRDAEQIW